ncbi:predicted protein [Nematostella vectensis]|uniref:Methyltransferase domain-containing protein n=1 Tax=Nematostella vectensis TaxID=45351 RepID=A7S1L4_NEMVE|nr:uncharacterized protein LOC5514219 [Nematostella vectensis]EDO42346.1 predicted protein [Nematostella vectensis]|eukprot:XP_001634409.1 predicted protein [Nematostella vectensis]
MRVITNIRFGRLVCFLSILLVSLFLFLLSHFTFHKTTASLANSISGSFHHWFQKAVFDHNWEDIHCRRRFKNETHVDEFWIKKIGEQLNIKDGQSIFDGNTGCNEWLRALRKEYPKLRIGGSHPDQYAVEYAQRIFNDTPNTFGVLSKENGKISFVDSQKYDHAINYAGLRDLGSKEIQCNLVRELLRIVKPGGSIYLGHNMEETECKVMEKYQNYVTLPGCYWSQCLKGRTDISEIYYIKESDLYGDNSNIDSCYTAVFIHKNLMVSRGKDSPNGYQAKYVPHPKKYECIPGKTTNKDVATKVNAEKLISNVVHPKNLMNSIKKYQELSKKRGNVSLSTLGIGVN